jgi:phosphoglycerate kinase
VIAGAKADKLTAIDNMLKIADKVLIGGALAFALKMAQGHPVGASKIDTEGMSEMPDLVDKINKSGKILLPVDAVVADSFSETANYKTVDIAAIEKNWMALDIGPRSTEEYVKAIKGAKTVFWFGPLGVFEWEPYSHSTKAVGEAIANSGALSIVGGGDSATAVEKFGLTAKMGFVSTGGGASLQMLEGKPLPAIEILKK